MGQWRRTTGMALATILSLMAGAAVVRASVGARDHDGTYLGEASEIKSKSAMSDGSTLKLQGERCVSFQPWEFVAANASGGIVSHITSTGSTTPRFQFTNNTVALSWYDNETSAAQLRFRVADGYISGGLFRALVGRQGSASQIPPAIDFQVFIDKDETAFDTAATDQTAVQINANINDGSADELTLNVTTDFASLVEGDWVTLEIWRDNTNTSTDRLLVYGVEFCGTFWE